MFSSLAGWIVRHAGALLLVALGLASILHLTAPIVGLPLQIPKDYNEGWNAFHALEVANSKPLYPGPSELYTNNYPPFSFYIMAILGYMLGDYIVAGRIMALVSFIIVGINIGLITRHLGVSIATAIFSGLLFISYASAYSTHYIAMNDPQWLAHALATTGLLVFLYRDDSKRSLILSASLIFAAGMTKNLLIPLPFAITMWLFIYDRPRFYIWIIVGSVLSLSSMALCYLAYGSNFFYDVLAAPRHYEINSLISGLYKNRWLLTMISAPVLLALVDNRPESRLLIIYAFASVAWGSFVLGGDGVDVNALFDFVIASSVAAGLTVNVLAQRFAGVGRLAMRFCVMSMLSLPIVMATTPRIIRNTWAYLQRVDDETYAGDIRYLVGFQGAAMCEDLALCYWAGKRFEVDFFNTGQKLSVGTTGVAERILDDIANKRFAVIQVYGESPGQGLVVPEYNLLPGYVWNKILANYRVDRRSKYSPWRRGFFLIPETGSN
jgi:hypothetical protein